MTVSSIQYETGYRQACVCVFPLSLVPHRVSPTRPAQWPARRVIVGRPGRHRCQSVAAAAASPVTRAQSCTATTSDGVIQDPPTQPTFGSARYRAAFAVEIPPVGQNRAAGIGELTDLR
jgi:hypothetical protein